MKKGFFLFLVIIATAMQTLVAQQNTARDYALVDQAIKANLKLFPLPQKFTEGIYNVDIKRSYNTVVYTFKVDEEMYDISDVKKYITGIDWKDILKEDSEINMFVCFIKVKKMNVKYKFVGNITGESFEILIRSGEY